MRYYQNWNMLSAPISEPITIRNSWQEAGANIPGYGTQITGPGGANGLDAPSPGYSMKAWDAQIGNWANVTHPLTDSVNRKTGFYLFARGDRSFGPGAPGAPTTLRSKGTIYNYNNSPDYIITVPATTFASVGNPFASAFSIEKFSTLNSDDIEDNFWMWDPSLSGSYGVGGYQTLSTATGLVPTPGGIGSNIYSNAPYEKMQSGQAFFVRSVKVDPRIRFNEGMKEDSSKLVSRGTPQNIQMLSTMLYTTAGLLRDGNRVVFDDAYSDGIDRNDARKLANAGINLGLSRNTISLAVEAKSSLKASDTLFYRMSGMPTGNFKLGVSVQNIQSNGLRAELIDKFLATRTPVSLTDSTFINFSTTAVAASKAADRFMLVFKPATPVVVLPVNFIRVSARRQADRTIAVNWEVANEVNIVRYEVERSADGVSFTGILTRDAAGNRSYAQADLSPLTADNFYRIKAIGLAGDITYSQVVKVSTEPVKAAIAVYPNPVINNTINLSLTRQPKGKYSIRLTSVSGQIMYNGNVNVNGDQLNHTIQPERLLAQGTYSLVLTSEDGEQQTIQVSVQ
ncbi:MAG: T9SS type A sorting domain-containing protein [Sphingobacteriales bacterium]|nr:MAG: T9SS type A sorting domain-containing protein [Sphingobacteriales bacterium]